MALCAVILQAGGWLCRTSFREPPAGRNHTYLIILVFLGKRVCVWAAWQPGLFSCLDSQICWMAIECCWMLWMCGYLVMVPTTKRARLDSPTLQTKSSSADMRRVKQLTSWNCAALREAKQITSSIFINCSVFTERSRSNYWSCAKCGFKNISKTVMDSWPFLTVLSGQNHCSARFSKEFNMFIPYSFKCQLLSFIWQLEAVHDQTCCRDAATCLAWVIMSLSWRWVEDSWMLLSFGKGLWSSM